jgi:hypothetical protein
VLLLALLSTAVPALLVAHCLSRVPLLRDVELVGGVYFPSALADRGKPAGGGTSQIIRD